MYYNGMRIEITRETAHYIFFTFDGEPLKVCKDSKRGWGKYDTRYITLPNNVTYDGIGFNVGDGVAISNGINETYMGTEKKRKKENCNIKDVVRITFPTIREILSDEVLFGIAVSYMEELGMDLYDYEKLNASDFFEGFFFSGLPSKYCSTFVNGACVDKKSISKEDAEQKLFDCIEDDFIGDRVYEFAQSLLDGYIKKVEEKNVVVGIDGTPYDGEDGTEWYDDARDEVMDAIYDAVKSFLND